MTRHPAVESVEDSIATPGGAGPAVDRHVRRASGNGPTRGLSLPLASVALNPASSRPANGPTAATDEHLLLRLALWLADVAAEAALAATSPAAAAPRRTGRSDDPPAGESAP